LSATSNKRWGLIVGGAAVVALGVFAYIKFATGPQEKEFSLIKPWFEPQGSGEVLSSGFFWVHRQCHESLVDTEVSGQILKRSAADVNRRGPRTWAFRISADAKWSDDGKAVTADDFVNAFTARSEKIRAPEFLRIKKVTAEKSTANNIVNNDALTVELNGDEDAALDMATLGSIWLTPLKLKKDSKWSWATELSGPCDGPFVPRQRDGEFILTRNQHWREFKPEYISVVKVTLDKDQSKKSNTQMELFQKGALSFVGPGSDDGLSSEKRAVYGRGFLEPKAYYMLINPRGSLGSGSYAAFPHHATNRGELAGVLTGTDKLFVNFRVLPLSLLSKDSLGQPVQLPPVNLESALEARQALGIKDTSVTPDKMVSPFKKGLKILANKDERMSPIVERFGARIKANYNIDSQIEAYEHLDKLPQNWDVLFFSVNTDSGIYGWSREMASAITKAIPSRADLAAKFLSLAKDKSETRISPKAVSTVLEIDALAPQRSVIIPVGQFGYEILIEAGVIDVSLSGEGRLDPDVSRARRLVINKSQGAKS